METQIASPLKFNTTKKGTLGTLGIAGVAGLYGLAKYHMSQTGADLGDQGLELLIASTPHQIAAFLFNRWTPDDEHMRNKREDTNATPFREKVVNHAYAVGISAGVYIGGHFI